LIHFNINNTVFNIQIIPVYGFGLGILYYNPNLEPDLDPVSTEEYYEQITVMLFFFGFHITWWTI
jgi:Na+-transporting NADH:ubiquinone oxidoreductase subunit NqrC